MDIVTTLLGDVILVLAGVFIGWDVRNQQLKRTTNPRKSEDTYGK